ncbi:triose-phosphate isomerase [Candidatus Spongiihabitans sp.]|uniref:triose-phosphate isomerase n=1 Tax=Candidatus Spongiihabitans sp. TaxID=3101308 RepID=UPI003C7AE32C
MRTPLIAGNWKMNGDQAMAQALCREITAGAQTLSGVEVLLCPPFTLLPVVESAIAGSACQLGAQDMDINENGAFTGQISAAMLKDCGCQYVILGHSERRSIYGESDLLVAQKVAAAVAGGLTAILCVGESQAERASAITEQVIERQVQAVIDIVGISSFNHIVIAYEPVWAIGSGLTATPQQAQQVHDFIRRRLARDDAAVAAACRILYGGSMKPDNAGDLLAQADIDGGLIGGAALKAQDFLKICHANC